MADAFFAGLRGGHIRMPDAAINYGTGTPLPKIPPGMPQFWGPDGVMNQVASLLPGGLDRPYAYGHAARISTQTQQAHPNKVQLIIHKLYIPSPESDGVDPKDPILQHALSDGDLAFAFRMGEQMCAYGSPYCVAPAGMVAKAVALINLATANYILWGLQVGLRGPKSTRWRAFFTSLMRTTVKAGPGSALMTEDGVWNFVKTFLRPFGVQHGGDQQGGGHEVDGGSIVTHGAVDYVSAFAIEGKLRHVNNLWRDHNVRENDDLILALRYKAAPHGDLNFVLSSSVRATRNERAPVTSGYYYLRPEVLEFRSFSDVPYIHIGRSMLFCSAYTRGLEACCWDARMPVTPGAPLLMTFEPCFVDSDRMWYESWEIEEDEEGRSREQTTSTEEAAREVHLLAATPMAADLPPPAHALPVARVTAAPLLASRPAPAAPRAPPPPPPSGKAKRQRVGGAAATTSTTTTSASAAVFALLTGAKGAAGDGGQPMMMGDDEEEV